MRAPLLAAIFAASPAMAEVPHVVTDIPVIQSLAAQVMGDLGQPAVLLGQGGNAHNYQMRPSEASELQNADLVFWISPKMTPWLERAIASGTKANVVALLDVPGVHQRQFGATGDDHDHANEHASEGDDHAPGASGNGPVDHIQSGLDPHAWLDPDNAAIWVGTMAAELSARDPEHAATYAQNASAALASIREADAEVAKLLAAAPHRPVVMFHDAYGYFAEHFGLDIEGTVALGDAATPGAARLQGIRDELSHKNVACIFPEAQHDPKLVATVVESSGVRIGPALDPSGSATEPGPDLYQRVITNLGRSIAGCLAES